MDLNQCFYAGHVGKDVEVKHYKRKDGTEGTIANFTLAINSGYGQNKKVVWIKCHAFDKQAIAISKYVTKGMNIFIVGTTTADDFQRADGSWFRGTSCTISHWQFCSHKGEKQEKAEGLPELPPPSEEEFAPIPDGIDEELPFA